MAKEAKKLDDLFHDTLKDIYFAEKKILSTLPKMAKAAQNEELKAAFEKHHGETEGQIERLEEVFALIEKKPQGKTCAAIVGITEEGAEIMTEYKGTPALDAGLLAAAQAVEHYEISRYGTLRTWAEELGLDEAATLLQETLDDRQDGGQPGSRTGLSIQEDARVLSPPRAAFCAERHRRKSEPLTRSPQSGVRLPGREPREPAERLEPAEQDQDQHDNQHEADAATAVIAGAVERTATNAAKAAEQDDNQDDEQNCSERHGVSP
jgi:ferritin-like metal-binding protein YciE